MSGFVFVLGPCFVCGQPFTFNPTLVPSVPIDPVTKRPPDLGGDPERARREPVCASCVERANVLRERNGLAPFVVRPGAYEAMPEAELAE